MDSGKRAHHDLRGALVEAVKRLSEGRQHAILPAHDLRALTRAKVEPLVRGLFPRTEQEAVLATLARSVIIVTGENIEQLLFEATFDHSAWTLANLYLASVDAPHLLSEKSPRLVGVSEETTCYVSAEYFSQDDPFADFIVHEAAHIFHNCKRATVGLAETRRKEWLLEIAFAKRETFAYACEAYSRLLERSTSPAQRQALADEYAKSVRISDGRVDPAEVASIVCEAAAARNGWRIILARCQNSGNGGRR